MITFDRFARMNVRHALLGGVLAVLLTGVDGSSPLAAQAPRHNAHSERAEQRLIIARAQQGEAATRIYFEALQGALQSIQTEPENANGWYIAGQVYRSLNDYVAADSMFDRALALYPGFAEDIDYEREVGWAEEYNRGAEAYNAGDIEAAISHFENAGIIFDKYADHLMILGYLYLTGSRTEDAANAYLDAVAIFERGMPEVIAQDSAMAVKWEEDRTTAYLEAGRLLEYLDRAEESVELYQRLIAIDDSIIDAKVRLATALGDLGRADEAAAILESIGAQAGLDEEQQFNLGVGFYQAQRFDLAADAFAGAFTTNPSSRDAVYNLAQSLFMLGQQQLQALGSAAAEEAEARRAEVVDTYQRLLEAAQKARDLDPFNRDMLFLQTAAYQALAAQSSDQAQINEYNEALISVIEDHDAMPFEVTGVALSSGAVGLVVSGRVQNLTQEAGTQARLRFHLVGQGGTEVGSGIATVTLPAQGEMAEFSVEINTSGEVYGWRYESAE
ncbi:MAG TPA: tetratricopeptide repeat protein [Longimicrobiales bacterium]|nr:tetratricopeptide repeat protein [Longimicrobiales bacterium]